MLDTKGIATNVSLLNVPISVTHSAGGIAVVEYENIFLTGTSGTFNIQWAQNTVDAGALVVLAGSYLEYSTF